MTPPVVGLLLPASERQEGRELVRMQSTGARCQLDDPIHASTHRLRLSSTIQPAGRRVVACCSILGPQPDAPPDHPGRTSPESERVRPVLSPAVPHGVRAVVPQNSVAFVR
ncbi:hypothetical protein ANO11243_078170 [Dothideomycetidae sp. 11243]|nr:hypothetical protein ANO11243_078170 [fungal sp. No.11243]